MTIKNQDWAWVFLLEKHYWKKIMQKFCLETQKQEVEQKLKLNG